MSTMLGSIINVLSFPSRPDLTCNVNQQIGCEGVISGIDTILLVCIDKLRPGSLLSCAFCLQAIVSLHCQNMHVSFRESRLQARMDFENLEIVNNQYLSLEVLFQCNHFILAQKHHILILHVCHCFLELYLSRETVILNCSSTAAEMPFNIQNNYYLLHDGSAISSSLKVWVRIYARKGYSCSCCSCSGQYERLIFASKSLSGSHGGIPTSKEVNRKNVRAMLSSSNTVRKAYAYQLHNNPGAIQLTQEKWNKNYRSLARSY